MNVSDLADLVALDTKGDRVRLGDEWRDRPAVVVWLRHFGCMFCKEQAKDYRGHQAEITALGGCLVFVGNGEVRWARGFAEEYCPDCRILTDPALGTYREIGAEHAAPIISGRVLKHALRALAKGNTQLRTKGPAGQQGGVAVIEPGDRVAYLHLSREAGDHPPIGDVLEALRAATAHAEMPGRPRRTGVRSR
jgi:peroxiredoxin